MLPPGGQIVISLSTSLVPVILARQIKTTIGLLEHGTMSMVLTVNIVGTMQLAAMLLIVVLAEYVLVINRGSLVYGILVELKKLRYKIKIKSSH